MPWKIALPAIMLLATIGLLYLGKICLQKGRGADDMPVSTAWGLICLLNWPSMFITFWLRFLPPSIFGFYVYNWYDWERLTAVLLFWACMGWLLDRRLTGVLSPVVRSKSIRVSLHTVGLLIALYAFVYSGLEVIGAIIVWFPVLSGLLKSRWIYLLGRPLSSLGGALWGLIGTLYFGNKLLRSRTQSSATM